MRRKIEILVFIVFIVQMYINGQPNINHRIIKIIKKDLKSDYRYNTKEINSIVKDIVIIPIYKRRLDSKKIERYTMDEAIVSYLKPYNRKVSWAYIYKADTLIGLCWFHIYKENGGEFIYFIGGKHKYEVHKQVAKYLLSVFNSSTHFFTIPELLPAIWIDDGKKIVVYEMIDGKIYAPEEFVNKYHNLYCIKEEAKKKHPAGEIIFLK